MPLNIKRLRIIFVSVAVVLIAAVIGFYSYARYRVSKVIREVPQKLGVDVQQSANGFKVTKSEGGRILFSISAGSAVQFKGTQRAQLKDARIVVYNHGKGTSDPATDIYDQIYGKQFDYDHQTGEIRAEGEVLIELQAKGTPPDDPAKTTANPGALHLKTSGLTFNEKTGVAETDQPIEFSLPQGSGSANGAVYDSKLMSVHLKSDVRLRTTPPQGKRGATPATITAMNADFFDLPREAILSGVQVEDEAKTRKLTAARMTIMLRDDNTIQSVSSSGGVTGEVSGVEGTKLEAQNAEIAFGQNNDPRTAILTGAVKLDSRGAAKGHIQATAGRADLEFAVKNQVKKIHATQQVNISSEGGKEDTFALNSSVVNFFLKPGNRLDRAVTDGTSQLILDSKPSGNQKKGSHTVAIADTFEATFASVERTKVKVQSVHGSGNTKVVSASPGNADRITTGKELQVRFDVKTGSVATVEQSGDFKYVEGQRNASADQAHLDFVTDQLTLSGSPRVQDQNQGFALTANSVKLNRKANEVNADGQVKATYTQAKGSATGVLFSSQSGEPVHATSQSMTASKSTGIARFSGSARLWQGANVIDAPTIVLDQQKRNVIAEGQGASRVQAAFVQTDKKGKVTPVSVFGGRLVYSDSDRKARFDGGVKVKTAEATMLAETAEVFLKARTGQVTGQHDSASQIDRIEALGNIQIDEQDPVRNVTGSRLIYTADEGKFVLTGEPAKPPSIFDAERGNLTGDSLTFYIHDDRVQVGSGENARVVTRTRIKDEKKP